MSQFNESYSCSSVLYLTRSVSHQTLIKISTRCTAASPFWRVRVAASPRRISSATEVRASPPEIGAPLPLPTLRSAAASRRISTRRNRRTVSRNHTDHLLSRESQQHLAEHGEFQIRRGVISGFFLSPASTRKCVWSVLVGQKLRKKPARAASAPPSPSRQNWHRLR